MVSDCDWLNCVEGIAQRLFLWGTHQLLSTSQFHSSSSSLLQSTNANLLSTLLTTLQSTLSTVIEHFANLQQQHPHHFSSSNSQSLRTDLSNLTVHLSLRMQLMDVSKSVLQSTHDVLDEMISALSNENENENENDCSNVKLMDIDISSIQSNLDNLEKLFQIPSPSPSLSSIDRNDEGTNEEHLSINQSNISTTTTSSIPPFRIPQLFSHTSQAFFDQWIIPNMIKSDNTAVNCSGMTIRDLIDVLNEVYTHSSSSFDISTNTVISQSNVMEVGHYHIQLHNPQTTDSVQSSSSTTNEIQLIIADTEKKEEFVLISSSLDSYFVELDMSGLQENVILDLNREGRRWEGGLLKRKRFGFGCEYSEEGNLVYEGFVFDDKRVCIGKEWNDDENNNCLMYEGGYCNDERWGRGISYDLNGNVDYEGEWLDNHGIGETGLIISLFVEEVVLANKELNDEKITSLQFSSPLAKLKRIEIGHQCFKHVREFVIDGLISLESVKIGKKCFRKVDEKRSKGVCFITNCPNLHQLEIGKKSFSDFNSFELSNLNSLQSIQFGDHYFQKIRKFVIDGLGSLESVKIGKKCFNVGDEYRYDGVCRIINCQTLRQLEIGDESFKDFNLFELSKVNSLQSIQFGEYCFHYGENFSLKGK